MKKTWFWIALASILTLNAAQAQESPGVDENEAAKPAVRKNLAPVDKKTLKVRFQRPKEYTLPNGLKIHILEDHRVPGTTVRLLLQAGTLYWPNQVEAEAAGSLLTEGTTTKTGKEIARIVDGMGAELTSGTGIDFSSLSISALSDYTEVLLDIIADVALNPSYPQDRLDNYKFRRIAGLPARKVDPDNLSSMLTARVNYGTSRFARPLPKEEEIQAVTREGLFVYHKAAFSPDRATITVVGDVDAKTVVERIKALFGEWKQTAGLLPEPSREFQPKDKTVVHIVDRPGSQQTMLRFTNIAVRRNHPDYIPLLVANRILGGGSTSRLFRKIREEKGYTYGAYSSLSAPRWTGTWGAYASVRSEVTGPAVDDFLAEFKRLQTEPVDPDELDRVKRTLTGSFARTLESPDNILGKYTELLRNDLPLDYWETYPKKINAVTADDVMRMARKYLGEGRIQIIAVGERESIEPVLKKHGPVIVYNTDIEPISQ